MDLGEEQEEEQGTNKCAQANPQSSVVEMSSWFLQNWVNGSSCQSGCSYSFPPLSDLETALSINRSMATSPFAARRLGGHVGWKMGWKGVFVERKTLCGPMFGVGMLRCEVSRTCE